MFEDESRRRFLKRAVYVPPMILSFKAAPAFARPGSVSERPPGIVTMNEIPMGGRFRLDPDVAAGPRPFRGEGALTEPAQPGHSERRAEANAGEQIREPGSGFSLANDKGADAASGSVPTRKGAGSS